MFEIRSEAAVARFRVHYNGKGFFTKLTVVEKSEDELGEKIRNWLIDGD